MAAPKEPSIHCRPILITALMLCLSACFSPVGNNGFIGLGRAIQPAAGLYVGDWPIGGLDAPINLDAQPGETVIDKAFAYVNANTSTYYTLLIDSDITLAPDNDRGLNAANARLIINGIGGMRTISLSAEAQGRMFTVGADGQEGITLQIGNNITLIGHSANNQALAAVQNGAGFIMRNNATLTGNSGGGIEVTGAGSTFTMHDGAVLSGNGATDGGGIYIDGGASFLMYGGTVYGSDEPDAALRNTRVGQGAAVLVNGGSNAYYWNGSAWTTIPDTPARDETIRVVNGVLQNEPIIGLTYITANYTGTRTIYINTLLDSFKDNLTVRAFFDNGTNRTLAAAEYELSGTLTPGTSVITVRYGGQTATFTVNDVSEDIGFTVNNNNPTSWDKAITEIRSGNNEKYIIDVTGNITIPGDPGGTNYTFGSARNIEVTITGNGTLTVDSAVTTGVARVLYITANQTVIVGETGSPTGPTLQFINNSSATNNVVVSVQPGGRFELRSGKITGGNTSSGTTTAGVSVLGTPTSPATFIMSGGEISGNTGGHSGGVHVSNTAIFTMSGGVISNNTGLSTTSGGGVFVGNLGTFTMSGSAEISGNISNGGGGGVRVSNSNTNSAIFTMLGGTIRNNYVNGAALTGGGVYVDNTGIFTKESGTIYGLNAGTPNWNRITNNPAADAYLTQGHAVYWNRTTGGPRFRDNTAGAGVNMSTSTTVGDEVGWE